MSEERRKQTRVHFETQVVLKSGESEIISNLNLRDISLKGMFVRTNKIIPIGAFCDIQILLTGTSNPLYLSLKGRIVRHASSGLGLHFVSIDADSYIHFKNLLMYNALDPDAMEKELKTFR